MKLSILNKKWYFKAGGQIILWRVLANCQAKTHELKPSCLFWGWLSVNDSRNLLKTIVMKEGVTWCSEILQECVLNVEKLWFIVRVASIVHGKGIFISCDTVLCLVIIINQMDCTGDYLRPPSRSFWKKKHYWQSLLIKSIPPKWICKDVISFYFFSFYII